MFVNLYTILVHQMFLWFTTLKNVVCIVTFATVAYLHEHVHLNVTTVVIACEIPHELYLCVYRLLADIGYYSDQLGQLENIKGPGLDLEKYIERKIGEANRVS